MKFRKKPVVIEAELFRGSDAPLPFSGRGDPCCFDGARWYIETLEGNHNLTDGDMVIRGVKGEFYPCKPDIFAATNEAVGESSDAVRLAADAVVQAAENYSDTFDPMHGALTEAHNELLEAVLAHRKAKAEQAKERA